MVKGHMTSPTRGGGRPSAETPYTGHCHIAHSVHALSVTEPVNITGTSTRPPKCIHAQQRPLASRSPPIHTAHAPLGHSSNYRMGLNREDRVVYGA